MNTSICGQGQGHKTVENHQKGFQTLKLTFSVTNLIQNQEDGSIIRSKFAETFPFSHVGNGYFSEATVMRATWSFNPFPHWV